MVALPQSFNPEAHTATEQTYDRPALPAGNYNVMITKEFMAAKETGVNVIHTVMDGPHEGRDVLHWLGFFHDDPDVVGRSWDALQQMCQAVGVAGVVADTEILVGKTCQISVIVQKKDPTRNNIKAWSPIGGAAAPAPAPEGEMPSPAAIQQAVPGTAPWKKPGAAA